MPDLDLYRQATTDVAAFDLSDFGKLVLRGKDAASFLQSFTTNDVVKPGPGSGCETFVLTAQAKIVAWTRVAIFENELYLYTEPGLIPRLLEHLERHQISEQVEFEDRTEADSLLHFCGPNLFDHLAPWGGKKDLAPWTPKLVAIHHASGMQETGFDQRADFLGLPGFFMIRPRTDSVPESYSPFFNVPRGNRSDPAWTMLRVEAGTPACGVDFDDTNLPQEINRTEQAISFTKGCYLGQETVARIRAYGRVNRQLVPIKFPTRTEPDFAEHATWYGAVLEHEGKDVGRVKTVSYSPRLGCWLAFAMLRREHVAVGTSLNAVHPTAGRAPVEVTTWPNSPGTSQSSPSH